MPVAEEDEAALPREDDEDDAGVSSIVEEEFGISAVLG